jgi:hypothetical protein
MRIGRRPRQHPARALPVSAAPAQAPAPAGTNPRGRRRELGSPQDQALYTCGCGFVFEAPVSTSVGCPLCGDTQAW